MSHRKIAILVAGMHRSGTSALSRLLNLVGCDLPKTLMKPVPGNNETGFWESQPVWDMNMHLLRSTGSDWKDWRPFDSGWYASPKADSFREQAQALLHQEFGDSRLFVLKDPVLCRLLPFWIKVLETFGAEPRVVLPIRNPLDVAASLKQRDGIGASCGYLIWLRHVLEAESGSRNLRRAYLRYETFLSEPHAVMDRLGRDLDVSWPMRASVRAHAEIERFLSPELHHHQSDDAAFLTNPVLSRWLGQCFELFNRWSRGEVCETDVALLDRIRSAFDEATPLFSRHIADCEQAVAERDGRIEELNGAVAERDGRIEELNGAVAERDGRIEGLSEAVTERDGWIEGLSGAVAERDGRIEGLSEAVAERDGRIEGLSGAVAERDGRIGRLSEAVAERDGRIEGLSGAVAERNRRIEGLSGAVAERNGRIEGLSEAVAERDGRIEGLSGAVAERDRRIEGLSEAVAERDGWIEGLSEAVAERDGWIEGLSEAVAERDGRIEGLHRSISIRITAPLRYLGRVSRWLLAEVRASASCIARGIYRRAPLPLSTRMRIKSRLFRLAPSLFRHTIAYQRWAAFTAHAPDAARSLPHGAGPIVPSRFAPKAAVEAAHATYSPDGRDGRIEGLSQAVPRVEPAVSNQFVPAASDEISGKLPVRLIAFYLPQFHPIPENDEWWGKGFTEWTNVSKATPIFEGHFQPRLPADLGFYDLRLVDVMEQQAELARRHGVHGFCYHYYWFGGKRLLEMPLERMLRTGKPDFPFCLCWANENWTRRWDGSEHEVLIAQQHGPEDDEAVIRDLIRYFRHSNYIRVDGRPLLLIYRISLLPDARSTVSRWRERCRDEGIGEIYLTLAETFELGLANDDPAIYGCDAAVEFPPHVTTGRPVKVRRIAEHEGAVLDYREIVRNDLANPSPPYTRFRGIMPGWDNTARTKSRAHIFHHADPEVYRTWLQGVIEQTCERYFGDERLVFVNAWNEWGEGAYLEPDHRYGHAYLRATRSALEDTKRLAGPDERMLRCVDEINSGFEKKNDVCVVFHLYYEDIADDIVSNYLYPLRNQVDLIVTTHEGVSAETVEKLRDRFPNQYIMVSENRGRDIRPFLMAYDFLSEKGYQTACKIHTKRSEYRVDADNIRNNAFHSLFEGGIDDVIREFSGDERLGLIVPRDSLLNLSQSHLHQDNKFWLDNLLEKMGKAEQIGKYLFDFSTGSMFWFRVRALAKLADKELIDPDAFEPESGQLDGALHHAVERIFSLLVREAGFTIKAATFPESDIGTGGAERKFVEQNVAAPRQKARVAEHHRLLSDREWTDLLIRSVTDRVIDGVRFPAFPSAELQESIVGASNESTLLEASAFYSLVKEYSEKLGRPITYGFGDDSSSLLDFGCGWGRFLRFFWRDVNPEKLYGVDINNILLQACRDTGVQANLRAISPHDQLPFKSESFSHIIAYSVFTHLPEQILRHGLSELARIAEPGCVFVCTVQPRRFFDFIASIEETPTLWHEWLKLYQCEVDENKRKYDDGEYVFLPAGGGSHPAAAIYGDAVIPEGYIRSEWSSLYSIRKYIDDPERFSQAVVVCQKPW